MKWLQVKVEWGINGRQGERERERSTGVREGTQKKTKNGVGRKRPMERTPDNLGIRRINKRQLNLLRIDFWWFQNC
jgi:hypothetical protein